MEKTKILFTHNTAMWYRLPFFKQLAKIYDLDLVFTHINVMAYSERYNNNDEIWQDYIISFIKKDGTAILLPGKDGTYTSDVTGDATCEDIAKNVWNLFKAVKKDFDSKSQNYGGEAF